MLWTVRNRWPDGARFSFNCYRHSSQLILRRNGEPCETLLSKEGVTQGDPLAMTLYGITLLPLIESLRKDVPEVLQPWYADDAAMVGKVEDLRTAMELLQERGPARGYFPEPSKSVFVPATPEVAEQCKIALKDFNFRHCDGSRYVGGFIGTSEAAMEWIRPQIEQWANGVRRLAKTAKHYPQTAFAGLSKSLQAEWAYLQRVVPQIADQFQDIEDAIVQSFLPALFDEDNTELIEELRDRLTLSVKKSGLGIPNPVTSSPENHESSKVITSSLVQSLIEGKNLNAIAYKDEASAKRRSCRNERIQSDQTQFDGMFIAESSKAKQECLNRARKSGAWLTLTPDRINGTELSEEEFRDSLRIRFGLQPKHLPNRCEGCHQRFSVEHAMSCKRGGLILLRHNDVTNEWSSLCSQALKPSAILDEPLIHNGRDQDDTNANIPQPELRGDIAVHGFWKRGTTAIFDVRVTDLNNHSQRGTRAKTLLARHEREKKQKYAAHCERQRKSFTPLVFSIDGLVGNEGDAAMKRLASCLSKKWGRTYSEVCGFVRSRMAVALARSASRCLRWDRNPITRKPYIPWDSGCGLALFQ